MLYINLDKQTEKRFDISKFVPFNTDMYDILDSYLIRNLKSLPVDGVYICVEDNTPDLISHKLYGDTQYWWLLLEYNGMLSNEDIKVGVKLNYFSLSSLEELYFSLQSKSLG